MRVLCQRVASASVVVDTRTIGEIGRGLLLLIGFGEGDDSSVVRPMADKVCGLRVFEDNGRFEFSVEDVGGELLAVPQFTLYGDTQRGRRPDFTRSLAPDRARQLFDEFVVSLRTRGTVKVEQGGFGAHMSLHLVNDGPVTLMLERSPMVRNRG